MKLKSCVRKNQVSANKHSITYVKNQAFHQLCKQSINFALYKSNGKRNGKLEEQMAKSNHEQIKYRTFEDSNFITSISVQ